MERLLHYVWQHRQYPFGSLKTTGGEAVEVIDPGLHNEDAGPDFFDAKIKIGGVSWVGNIEIHSLSTDWFRHHHEEDAAYNNVILHVVEKDDGPVTTLSGRSVKQVVLQVPDYIKENYDELLTKEKFPPCYSNVMNLPFALVRQWLDCLAAERMKDKTQRICERTQAVNGDWENVLFLTLARSFGFGLNGDAFEEWGNRIPLLSAGHHRDDVFQLEALFLGQAGLLEDEMLAPSHRKQAVEDGYFQKLQHEYRFLAHKFSLQQMDGHHWRFLRLRPQNFPHIRIVQIANLFYSRRMSLSALLEAKSLQEVRALFHIGVTPYWQTHYSFGAVSRKASKELREASVDSLIINTVVPILYAYGCHSSREDYKSRALDFLAQLKAERNHITRVWMDLGLVVHSAADSQALIQLRNRYCDRKDCLRCRFGWEYLKKTKIYSTLQEPEHE